jgi:hypothetical protein
MLGGSACEGVCIAAGVVVEGGCERTVYVAGQGESSV